MKPFREKKFPIRSAQETTHQLNSKVSISDRSKRDLRPKNNTASFFDLRGTRLAPNSSMVTNI